MERKAVKRWSITSENLRTYFVTKAVKSFHLKYYNKSKKISASYWVYNPDEQKENWLQAKN